MALSGEGRDASFCVIGAPVAKRRRILLALAGMGAVAVAAAAVPAWGVAMSWAHDADVLMDAHLAHEVAHPGWSFPGKIVSRPVPDDLPVGKLIAEAKARDYVEDCKDTGPGEFCTKTGVVVPRTGNTLEPIELGWLVGPDGEIRFHLRLDQAPKHLTDAIMAAEDSDFREHRGVNFTAMLRAVWANAKEGGYAQGASTLTMQVVRNLSQDKEKTISRKLREIVSALAIDKHLGKDGVLGVYLDMPYLGQRGSYAICGFEAAAWHYYGKHASQLTLGESATLAAILPAPGRFGPDRDPAVAKERRDRVLAAMHEKFGYDVTEALAEPVTVVAPLPIPERYPVWLSATRAWLEAHLDPAVVYGAGLTVEVGLDAHIQAQADDMFPKRLPFYQRLVGDKGQTGSLQAAGVMVDEHTGLVLGLYGGTDTTATSFNRATQARRQPGSSFKPLVYALAFEQRNPDGTPKFTAATTEPNSPREFQTAHGVWRPRNVSGEATTTASLAYGLTFSQNIATASLLEQLGGPKPLIAFAQKLGFDTSAFPEEMGLALGQGEVTPIEMAQFASIVGNGGHKISATPVWRVVDAAGVERIAPPTMGEAVISPEADALTRGLMRLVVEIGTGGAARWGGLEPGYLGPLVGKTGTTDSERDLWFIGATPKYAAALWIGYDQPTPLGFSASDFAAPMWGWWMHRATQFDGPPPEWEETVKIEQRGICGITGKVTNATCRGLRVPFLVGTAPRAGCTVEHPPPPPDEAELLAQGASKLEDGTWVGPDGLPLAVQPRGHQSIWKRLAAEQAASATAAAAGMGVVPNNPAPAPELPGPDPAP